MIRAMNLRRGLHVMKRTQADLRPPRGNASFRWIWAVWTVLCVATAILSVCLISTGVSIKDTRQYRGIFSPVTMFEEVHLPADVPLGEVLVREGDVVTLGQRLVSFDVDRLEDQIRELEVRLALNQRLQSCLLQGPNQVSLSTPEPVGLNETTLAQQVVTKECRLVHQEHAIARQDLLSKKTALQSRLRVFALSPRAAAAGGVEWAIETQKIINAISALDIRIATLATEQDLSLLEETKSLEQQAWATRRQVERLREYAETPWVTANQNGVVERVRLPREGGLFSREIAVLRLRGQSVNRFEAKANIAVSKARLLRPGDIVKVRLSGLSLLSAPIDGQVSDLTPAPGLAGDEEIWQVSVELDPAKIEDPALRDLVLRLLTSSTSASSLTFEQQPASVFEIVKRSMSNWAFGWG
jgi:multidrug efflux pump subunit AcrA (membrane-fusion protein)